MATSDELLKAFEEIGPDLVKVASGLEAITKLVSELAAENERTQAANRGRSVFDEQEARALENARRGNLLLPQAPIDGWRAG